MMRVLAITACALALTACGSGENVVLERAVSDLREDVLGGDAAEQAPARPLERADVEAAGRPAILARLIGDASPTLLYRATRNGPYDTYVSELGQSIVLQGGLVTGTRGLGYDLLSVRVSANDPLVRPTPLAAWPAQVTRSYELPDFAPRGRVETYACRFERGPATEMTILGRNLSGIEISEYCDGDSGSFEGLHFVDPGSGVIWRSVQWTGPEAEPIDVQVVVRP